MELSAGDVVVRPWRPEDAPAVVDQANDRRVWLGLRDRFPYPYTIENARMFIELTTQASPPTHFAVLHGGRVAGGIGYEVRTDVERVSAELGYWLGTTFWRRGIATAAVRLVTAWAFRAHPGLRRLYAMPFASNLASARVLTKAGYRLEGTLRQAVIKADVVQDQLMFAILRDELADTGYGDSPGESESTRLIS